MAIIDIDQLTVKYPGRKLSVVQDMDLKIRQGETVLLLGASGSGKSTLALTLNGLIPQEMGKILHGSVRVADLDTQRSSVAQLAQQVGIVFQDPEAQFATLIVEDEIVFGLENLRLPPHEMEARLEQALAQVSLSAYRHRRVDQLSGGEKQRIALASLLAMKPSILVFDEPTANLDPVSTRDVFSLIRECKQQGQHTIILIEHKLDSLMDLIDRVVVLGQRGVVLADGAPRDVFRDAYSSLQEHGIWIPQIAQLAHELRLHGVTLDPFPITIAEGAEILQPLITDQVATEAISPYPQTHESIALEICNLTYRVGKKTILNNLSLNIPTGDFLAIVGANGAGKTTLAQHLVDILSPPLGSVRLQGKDVSRIAAKELVRQVGYVFQNPEHQMITDSVFDEVAYGLRVMGIAAEEIEERVQSLLERFGLLRLAKANPFTLSHGEKRRLSVATMLAVGQQTLIFDEPTFGQDQGNTDALMEHLSLLHQEGRTIVMITHDMALVARYARHVAVIHAGEVLFSGTPSALFEQQELLTQSRLELPPLLELSNRLGMHSLHTPEAFAMQLHASLMTRKQEHAL